MTTEELDAWIERFKMRFRLIHEALGEMDEIRQKEFKELNRRTTTLEYALARLYEERNSLDKDELIEELEQNRGAD